MRVSVANIEWLVPALLDRPKLVDRIRAIALDPPSIGPAISSPAEYGRLRRRFDESAEDDPLVRLLETAHHLTAVEMTMLPPNLNLFKALERAGVLPRLRFLQLVVGKLADVLPEPARAAIFTCISHCRAVRKLVLFDTDDYLSDSLPIDLDSDHLMPVEAVQLVISSVSDPPTALRNLLSCIDPATIRSLELGHFALTGPTGELARCIHGAAHSELQGLRRFCRLVAGA